ncbi:MAG: PTS sugar transporter subunit IIA [Planctomycetes bacterium]|nr:PTS sugar transporter subunit IIA [Planctomycetota bacterium]
MNGNSGGKQMANFNGSVKFSALFGPRDIICDVGAASRDEVIRKVLERLAYDRGIGNVDEAYGAVMEREEAQCTVIAPGVALPHARLEAVAELVVGVATSREGIDFCVEGQAAVKLVIVILVPKDAPGSYLQAVSSLAGLVEDAEAAERVAGLGSAEEVWRYFDRGAVLPEHLCAGDIMSRNVVSVQETDKLEHAIDMFAKHNLVDLPVLDKTGELVGMVSAYELLRVALPDYLLWMEDLSPIMHFEPFVQVLKNEGKTWLADIMSTEYATVPVEAPAVQVAREIARGKAREVFVVKGKKLVGVVTLQGFIRKVLRD